jgi:hypothetical protein
MKTRLLSAGFVLLAITTGFCIGLRAYVPPSPIGIWTHGDTVLVFATFPACKDAAEPSQNILQTLVSTDGGRNWVWRGPRLMWSTFDSILDTGDEIWIAGYNYDAEGPGSDPFVLRFEADSMDWPQLQIYNGYAELMAIAHDDHDGNRFLAWVTHLMLLPEDPDYDENDDPMFLHESLDRGQTWHAVKKVESAPKSMPGTHFFQDIPRQSGAWRIANADHGGKAFLEHMEADRKWHAAGKLPLPELEKCEE